MVRRHHVEGFDEVVKLLDSFSPNSKVVMYFCGKVDEKGINWCPDCQTALTMSTVLKVDETLADSINMTRSEPIVNEVIEENASKNFEFVHVSVGSREEWKNPTCKFRVDPRFKLTSVPTLMIYKAVERLNDVECQDKENIRALLEDIC